MYPINGCVEIDLRLATWCFVMVLVGFISASTHKASNLGWKEGGILIVQRMNEWKLFTRSSNSEKGQ